VPDPPSDKAERLRALHQPGNPLVLANVWDAASARVVADAGFPAIATSSGAVARSLGYPDTDAMPADLAFAAVARIARAVPDLPVTADLEAGYGLPPHEFAERLLASGAVGCNFEDTDHHGAAALRAAEEQAARIHAIKEAAGDAIVLNARVDAYLRHGPGDTTTAELIERGRLYRDAGADCVFPIGVIEADVIAALVNDIPAPVNVLLRPGAPTMERLGQLGVARVSVGSGLQRVAAAAVADAAARLRAQDASAFVGPTVQG
jgi:2-methylisocitrate lyase-like PEP mutase family enzyme